MEYHIVVSSSPEGLSGRVKEYIKEGWKPVGGHTVVEVQRQNRFAGQQHMDTLVKSEYSQTIVRE